MNTKLNMLLGITLIVLSLLSINWHHDAYLLYKQSKHVEQHQQTLLMLNKQLLSEKSQQMSGAEIERNALTILKMHLPKKYKTP